MPRRLEVGKSQAAGLCAFFSICPPNLLDLVRRGLSEVQVNGIRSLGRNAVRSLSRRINAQMREGDRSAFCPTRDQGRRVQQVWPSVSQPLVLTPISK